MSLLATFLRRAYALSWSRRVQKGLFARDPHELLQAPGLFQGIPATWLNGILPRWRRWSVDDEVSTLTAHGPHLKRLYRAKLFCAQAEVKTWVTAQNQKGVAPSGPAMCHFMAACEARRHGRALSGASRPLSRKVQRRCKQWLRRWRLRGILQKGRFKDGVALQLSDARFKAAVVTTKVKGAFVLGASLPRKNRGVVRKNAAPRGTLVARILCPENGPQNRDHATDCLLRQDPKNGRKTMTTFVSFGPKVPQHFCCDPWRRPPRGGGPISSQPPRQTPRESSISTWTRLPSECGILDLGDG